MQLSSTVLQVLDLNGARVARDGFQAYLSGLHQATALTELDLGGIDVNTGPEPFMLPPNVVKVNLAGVQCHCELQMQLTLACQDVNPRTRSWRTRITLYHMSSVESHVWDVCAERP